MAGSSLVYWCLFLTTDWYSSIPCTSDTSWYHMLGNEQFINIFVGQWFQTSSISFVLFLFVPPVFAKLLDRPHPTWRFAPGTDNDRPPESCDRPPEGRTAAMSWGQLISLGQLMWTRRVATSWNSLWYESSVTVGFTYLIWHLETEYGSWWIQYGPGRFY